MKQTSLLQSWSKKIRLSSSSLCETLDNEKRDELVNSDASSFLNNELKFSQDIDSVLSNLPDEVHGTVDNLDFKEKQKFIQLALSRNNCIKYYPTTNDDRHLDEFNTDEGEEWLYPSNFDLRLYQLNIIEQCLFKNTLISLPTGLGKTFIAAVIMYNFLRWYPNGKVVFMAPTRPLVSQQLNACVQFLGSQFMMIELTGSINQTKRKSYWTEYRVFFLTPHTLVNDLQLGVCPARSVCLVIVDEAHKATGNHVYCQVIRLLTNEPYVHRQFRVIALTATPASDVEGVQNVIANLLISHLEMRTEDSEDVKIYTQDKHLETVVVPLGPELNNYRIKLIECLREPLERLHQIEAIHLSPKYLRNPEESLSKFTIVKAREQWINGKCSNLSSSDMGLIQRDFGLVICLLHALELLIQHGLRPVYHYLEGVFSGQRASAAVRSQLNQVSAARQLHFDLKRRFNFDQMDEDGLNRTEKILSTQTPFLAGHPKLEKLKSILLDHFKPQKIVKENQSNSTRAIVFSQFRDSVEEIMHMLKQQRPVIRPASLIGQGSKTSNNCGQIQNSGLNSPNMQIGRNRLGVTQRDQIRVMDAFKSGVFNTLVSTCVGEEGLDIGQVDLIVCFDAYKSPIRLVQRLGRTGRKRCGRIIMLLAEGREQRNHAVSVARSSSIQKALLQGGAYRRLAFYPHNPRMVPIGLNPKLKFIEITSCKNTIKRNLKPGFDEQHEAFEEKQDFISSKVKKNRKRCNDRQICLMYAESIGLNNYKIRLNPLDPQRLLTSSNFNIQGPRWPCLTESYNKFNLASNLLNIQAVNGSSFSTRHMVSMFRLIRLHQLNQTVLSFHALGLRSIDVDTEWTKLVGQCFQNEDMDQIKNTQMKIQDSLINIDKSIVDVSSAASIQPTSPNANQLKLIEGPVSKEVYFDPLLTQFINEPPINILDQPKANLTLDSLRNSWIKLLEQQLKRKSIGFNPNYSISNLECLDTSNIDLKLSIDDCLLEVFDEGYAIHNMIENNKNCYLYSNQHNTVEIDSYQPTKHNHVHKNITTNSKADAKNKPIDKNKVFQSSYLDLSDALALLNSSSVHLDTSTILPEDDQMQMNKLKNQDISVVFESNACHGHVLPLNLQISTDLFSFESKLSICDDLRDFVRPTQIEVPISEENIELESKTKSESNSFHSIDSQINWSPVNNYLVHDKDEFQADILIRPKSSPINTHKHERSVKFNNTKSPSLQISESSHNSLITKNKIEHLKLNSSYAARNFFITQAQCNDNQSITDDDKYDEYESSFIDDRTDEDATKSKLNTSDMMGIYLQTIKSPNVQYKNKPKHNCANGTSSPEFVDDIAFQEPDSDEYELDSFCIADDQSLSFEKQITKPKHVQCHPKKRRRIVTGSQM